MKTKEEENSIDNMVIKDEKTLSGDRSVLIPSRVRSQ